jgi:hypothetical protein
MGEKAVSKDHRIGRVKRWISSRPTFLVLVRVLGALISRLFLPRLLQLPDVGKSHSSAVWRT